MAYAFIVFIMLPPHGIKTPFYTENWSKEEGTLFFLFSLKIVIVCTRLKSLIETAQTSINKLYFKQK